MGEGGGEVLIPFCSQILRTILTLHKRGNLKYVLLCTKVSEKSRGFQEMHEKNSPVTYISGGKSSLRLVHKFLNHTCLSIKFTLQY